MHPSAVRRAALEQALEDAKQTRIPIAQQEQQKKRHREVVLGGYGIPDRGGEVAADQQLDPGDDAEALTVLLLGYGLFASLQHPVLGRTGEGALDAEESFEHSLGIRDRKPDAQRHQERNVKQRLVPASREQFFLADQIETGD